MDYRINWDNGVFAVPDKAADCLKLASGKSVKVLLYFMKYKCVPAEPSDIGVTSEDIEDALNYWEQVGVLYRGEQSAPALSAAAQKQSVQETHAAPELPEIPKAAPIKPQKALLPTEIADRIAQSEEIAFLFSSAEASLGRVLTFTDQRTILSFYDHLGLSADIIIMLIAFCSSIGRTSMAYIERIADDWQQKNITTHEQAENEMLLIQKNAAFESQVQSRLKLPAKLSASQKKYISDWAQWDMSVDMVELAYDKTVDSTGKVTFNYMNKILAKWHDNGITTAEQAQQFDERTKPVPKTEKSFASGKASVQKNRENADTVPTFDISAIMEHAMNSTPTV